MKIGAFSAQRFGLNRVSNPHVLSALVKIISRYDIVVVLEFRAASDNSAKLLSKELNRVNTSHHYAWQLSTRLAHDTLHKEQFLFLYKDDVVDLVDCYQYKENRVNDTEAFTNEPYVLLFKPHNTVLKNMVLIPVPTERFATERELDEVYDVFMAVKSKWRTDNIMILGDFHAHGAYFTQSGISQHRIWSDVNFHWLLCEDVDATAKKRNEHYDRIIVYGADMLAAIVPNSAKLINFHEELSQAEEEALQVRELYPVEVDLHRRPPFWTTKHRRNNLDPSLSDGLMADIVKLQKENLQLQQEKLQLQISYLRKKLADFNKDRDNKLCLLFS